jgi:hypothetical protein
MNDPVFSAEEHGIRVVELCAESIEKDPRLIQKVRSGQYTMVFVSAEFTAPGNESWKQLVSQVGSSWEVRVTNLCIPPSVFGSN